MKYLQKSGAALAAAAFSLALSGAVFTPAQGEDAKIECLGVNACKGLSECKTANTGCKAQNACKGQGWLPMTKAECDAAGGKVQG